MSDFWIPDRYKYIIPICLFFIFITLTVPGISWGTPSLWHPDELVEWVDKALRGKYVFDETRFNYPSLPKYIMFAIGKIVYSLGFSRTDFIISTRFFSVLLGASLVVLVYLITNRFQGKIWAGLLSSAFLISCSEFSFNSRIAHNDIYLAFFASLTVYLLLIYQNKRQLIWLYASFLCVGFTASSKYHGISLLLLPLLMVVVNNYHPITSKRAALTRTIIIGISLSILGYVIGTPKAIFHPIFYLRQVIALLLQTSQYGRQPGTVIGLIGQWESLRLALGLGVLIVFIIAFFYYTAILILHFLNKLPVKDVDPIHTQDKITSIGILLMAIILLDLPMLLSYNYPPRFFITIIPLLSVLTALFIQDLVSMLNKRNRRYGSVFVILGALCLLTYSFLRVFSLTLLLFNDARIPASAYIAALPLKTSIEYTLYPPTIPEDHFSRRHSYPIRFQKFPDQPEREKGKIYKFNTGENGLEKRETDYLVIDNFTYERFEDDFVCLTVRVECKFFKRLLKGKTNLELLATFKYNLPGYLPQVTPFFINPTIQVYKRTQ